jgi:hypothetical protein
VLDEPWFKKFLRFIETEIRRSLKDFGEIRDYDLEREVESWFEYKLRHYGAPDGMLFKYNKRWVEILVDGSGDYRSLLEFLEDEFGSIENWLMERVVKGYKVVRKTKMGWVYFTVEE